MPMKLLCHVGSLYYSGLERLGKLQDLSMDLPGVRPTLFPALVLPLDCTGLHQTVGLQNSKHLRKIMFQQDPMVCTCKIYRRLLAHGQWIYHVWCMMMHIMLAWSIMLIFIRSWSVTQDDDLPKISKSIKGKELNSNPKPRTLKIYIQSIDTVWMVQMFLRHSS